jgi:hypothetical protein
MLHRRNVLCVSLSCIAMLPCYGQTPLAKAFADLKSTDPKVADEARKQMIFVAERELPTIEKDARCTARCTTRTPTFAFRLRPF